MNFANNNEIKEKEAKLSKLKHVTNPETGGLYEIWIDESPEAVLIVGPAGYLDCFNVVVHGKHETIPTERIFETGTAPQPDFLTSPMALGISYRKDQKFLKMLSETMLNK